MRNLLVLALVGLVAQLVDGALGMSYGATSSSLLLLAGVGPAVASASVHLAEVGTTLASGTSHWRFGNVDRGLVLRLGVPGALGGFLGATLLSSISTALARPVMSLLLLAIGIHLLVRFALRRPSASTRVADTTPPSKRFLSGLGLVAGFVDATGGGGWGPLSTPALLLTDRIEPRKVIGSVSAAEFMVTVAASVGFLLSLGTAGFAGDVVVALLAGGLVAAPIAAWLVRRVPSWLLGVSVGGLLTLTNGVGLLAALGVGVGARWGAAAAVLLAWGASVAVARQRHHALATPA